jgi:hypothetical protein
MTVNIQEADAHFEKYIDEVADIMREFMRRWAAEEQVDDDMPDSEARKRAFIGFAYPTPDAPAHVFMKLWFGGTGKMKVGADQRSLGVHLSLMDYECATIDVQFLPENGDEYLIDGEHKVFSTGELRDRMTVMWNSDHWNVRHEYIEENALTHKLFVPLKLYFKQEMKNVTRILTKLGERWGGEMQKDNAPDSADKATGNLLGGLIGGGQNAKQRFFVGFTAPVFRVEESGKARITRTSITLDTWRGKKGTIKKSPVSRRIEHHPTTEARRVVIDFTDVMTVAQTGSKAKTAKELSQVLAKLYRDGRLKLE